MASRSSDSGRTDKMDGGHVAGYDGQNRRMTLTRKLMMCTQLLAMEAVVNFKQIYTVPTLQTLGMPLKLVFLVGMGAGPSFMSLLVLGWLVDRGHNPLRRKFASIFYAASLQTLGLLTLLSANLLHLSQLLDSTPAEPAPGSPLNESEFLYRNNRHGSASELDANASGPGHHMISYPSLESGEKGPAVNSSFDVASSDVPFKAVLAMLAFIFMDFGFDASNCFVKAFMVTCSPRADHTSLLVLGVVMGASGGVINSVVGMVDFTSLLGLRSFDNAKLTIQSSAQDLLIMLLVFAGLSSTFTTGRKQLRQLQATSSTRFHENKTRTASTKFNDNRIREDTAELQRNTAVSNNDDLAPNPEPAQKMKSSVEAQERSHPEGYEHWNSSAEDVPLLEDHPLDTEAERLQVRSLSVSYGAVQSAARTHEEATSVKETVRDAGLSKRKGESRGCPSCVRNPKVRILFVCATSFFSAHSLTMFSTIISDFVGKEVYGGDPGAEPGSDSFNRYQEGVTQASSVLLVYFLTYLFASILHPTVLAVLGFRVEFLLLQSLMAVTMMTVALTSRIEVVFVLSVVAAMHRTCHYTMPYAVTNDIAQTIVSTGTGRNPVGQAMSVVAGSLPLSSLLLYTWVGAFEELTGEVSAPLWLGCGAGCLAVIAFLFVGKV